MNVATPTVPNQNYPQGVFNPVYACFTVVEDTRCILRMHNERIYSVTLAQCRINHIMGLAQGKFNGPLEYSKSGAKLLPAYSVVLWSAPS